LLDALWLLFTLFFWVFVNWFFAFFSLFNTFFATDVLEVSVVQSLVGVFTLKTEPSLFVVLFSGHLAHVI